MRLRPDCIACFLRQTVNALRMASLEDEVIEEAQKEVMKYLIVADWNVSPPEIDYVVQAIIRKYALGDPYARVKKRSNDEALELYGECKEVIRRSENPLKTAIKISIAGNMIDFGPYTSYDLRGTLERLLNSELRVDHYDLFNRTFERASSVLYFSDNAGEIVFDKLLLETMLSIKDLRIAFVVKGGPMINDATVEDFNYVSLSELDNIDLRTVSNGDPGTGPDRRSDEVAKWIKEHDLVISKGQGNYEVLGELSGVFHMLIVKCPVVAQDLGLNQGDAVLLYR
ncbi:MAG: ARMT1-like domain-containing protein [Candidatus Korarchaeum sp.]|nr:ARMT1-like domain-containing protein [Candidatus Korarchaeum sp.]MDW8034911.1 ARMT1-like domain-containing protein [Candidatus Korarchaeum sp.]